MLTFTVLRCPYRAGFWQSFLLKQYEPVDDVKCSPELAQHGAHTSETNSTYGKRVRGKGPADNIDLRGGVVSMRRQTEGHHDNGERGGGYQERITDLTVTRWAQHLRRRRKIDRAWKCDRGQGQNDRAVKVRSSRCEE